MGKPKFDLALIIVSHRVISAATVHSLENLRNSTKISYTLALFIGDALISRGRSQACSRFLTEIDAPYMIFIDDDITFTPEDIGKIYHHLTQGYDIIGGIYPVRGASQLSSYGFGGNLMIDGQIREIEYLATGFMGISRRILEKMRDELKMPWVNPSDWAQCWPFFEAKRCLTDRGLTRTTKAFTKKYGVSLLDFGQLMKHLGVLSRPKGDPIYISEDWDFCEKARQIGCKIYADTSVQLGHMREQVFTAVDVRQIQTKETMEKEFYGAINHQSDLMQKVDEDLSEFLHRPIGKIREQLPTATWELRKQWLVYKGTTEDYYKDNLLYLLDLAAFNLRPLYYQNRIGQLVNISKLKVLDIGCGIGTTVFMMAEQGNEVVGWDINQKCIEFCNYKKKKYNLGGKFTTEKPDYSQFDLIVAVDVLEHIEDLQGFLVDLGKNMKYGAKFYHSDYFGKDDKPDDNVWPMHFTENKEHLRKWLENAKLISWDDSWAIKSK